MRQERSVRAPASASFTVCRVAGRVGEGAPCGSLVPGECDYGLTCDFADSDAGPVLRCQPLCQLGRVGDCPMGLTCWSHTVGYRMGPDEWGVCRP